MPVIVPLLCQCCPLAVVPLCDRLNGMAKDLAHVQVGDVPVATPWTSVRAVHRGDAQGTLTITMELLPSGQPLVRTLNLSFEHAIPIDEIGSSQLSKLARAEYRRHV